MSRNRHEISIATARTCRPPTYLACHPTGPPSHQRLEPPLLFTICYFLQIAAKVDDELNMRRDDDDDDDEEYDDAGIVLTSQLLAETRRERTQSRSVFSCFISV